MPCSSFRYPTIFFIPASSCALLVPAARSRILSPASPPSCGRLTARLHLIRPHVCEPVALQGQHHGCHPIPRDPEPHGSRLDHLELILGDLTEEPCLLEHLEDQRSLATVVVELHDHERLSVAHARSLSNLREASEVLFNLNRWCPWKSSGCTAGDVPGTMKFGRRWQDAQTCQAVESDCTRDTNPGASEAQLCVAAWTRTRNNRGTGVSGRLFSASYQQLSPFRRPAMQARISVSTREGRRHARILAREAIGDKTPSPYPHWDKRLPLRPAPPSGPSRPPGSSACFD